MRRSSISAKICDMWRLGGVGLGNPKPILTLFCRSQRGIEMATKTR